MNITKRAEPGRFPLEAYKQALIPKPEFSFTQQIMQVQRTLHQLSRADPLEIISSHHVNVTDVSPSVTF